MDHKQPDDWDRMFRTGTARFNPRASRLITAVLDDRPRQPGTALDLGMGQGRNAIFLAQRGWKVTGVDVSQVAVAQVNKRAAMLGVALTTATEDLDRYDFGRERWNLIALFYMHLWYRQSKLDNALRLTAALKPGGLVLIEGFIGGEDCFGTNELLRAFGDLTIHRYEDVMEESDWTPGQKSHIVRFAAVKPQIAKPSSP